MNTRGVQSRVASKSSRGLDLPKSRARAAAAASRLFSVWRSVSILTLIITACLLGHRTVVSLPRLPHSSHVVGEEAALASSQLLEPELAQRVPEHLAAVARLIAALF